MAKNQETINTKLENFLKAPERRYNPETFDSSGKEIISSEAEVFRFRFIKDGEDYGPVTISVDGTNTLTVYFGDKVKNSPVKPKDGSESWHKFLKSLANWAYSNDIKLEIEDEISLGSDMAKRAHKQKMNEGYYALNKKTSYSDNIPAVTMRIQHSREMMEGEQRFRNINKIFFETQEGERILSPTNKPGLARTFARHLAEGGKANDDRWNHIVGLCEEYSKMAGFVRATKSGQFNESVQRLISEGVNHYQSLRETLHKIAGKKGYSNYFESWTPALMENEEQVDLSEMFMTSTLDPRIESVMPILGKLSKNITEDKLDEADMFEEWAESIANEGIGPEQKRVGQLGPTEKITKSNPTRGKLVGASESVEEGLTGAALGGVAGAYLGKSPAAAMTGAQLGSEVQDMFSGDDDEQGVAEGVDNLLRKYYRNENDNLHSENVVLLAQHFGTPSELRMAKQALAYRNEQGGFDYSDPKAKKYLMFQQEINKKYYPLLKRQGVAEGTYNKDVERAFPDGKASGVKTGASAPKGTSTMPKDKEKAKGKPAGAITEMDSEGYKGTRDDYELGKGKEHTGKPVTANKAKKDFAKIFQKSIDKHNKAKQDTDKKVAQHQVKEGQSELESLLKLLGK